uniref:Uncharacterized protein n=1 Tax=Arundo donax TaxID=35708 RepID=A0A0A9F962_ARUDO
MVYYGCVPKVKCVRSTHESEPNNTIWHGINTRLAISLIF